MYDCGRESSVTLKGGSITLMLVPSLTGLESNKQVNMMFVCSEDTEQCDHIGRFIGLRATF